MEHTHPLLQQTSTCRRHRNCSHWPWMGLWPQRAVGNWFPNWLSAQVRITRVENHPHSQAELHTMEHKAWKELIPIFTPHLRYIWLHNTWRRLLAERTSPLSRQILLPLPHPPARTHLPWRTFYPKHKTRHEPRTQKHIFLLRNLHTWPCPDEHLHKQVPYDKGCRQPCLRPQIPDILTRRNGSTWAQKGLGLFPFVDSLLPTISLK